jgi:hypothetical protein
MVRIVAAMDPAFAEYYESAVKERQEYRSKQNREEAEREERKRRRRAEEAEQLRAEIEAIRSGKHLYLLSWLLNFARQRSNSHSFSSVDWTIIATELGEDIASAGRAGAIAFWRTYRPALPHEGVANQTPVRWQ